MGTRFELVLYGDDPVRLRAAGEEALLEIARLDSQLSFYSGSSEISRINARASQEPVKIEARLFNLLRNCIDLAAKTDGAFDITVGPLMRAWGSFGREGRVPSEAEVESIKSLVGVGNIGLGDEDLTIRFKRSGVQLDLGAYGKGYAIDRAIGILNENGVTTALLHGGRSSIRCLGPPPGADGWLVGLHDLFDTDHGRSSVSLRDSALSFSALHGKSFIQDGRTYGHVLDPRTCKPISGTLAAMVTGQCAAVCEALSTALLVNGPDWLSVMAERFSGFEGKIVPQKQIRTQSSLEGRRFAQALDRMRY
jgi:thiamine biosynthesis lipoprotein